MDGDQLKQDPMLPAGWFAWETTPNHWVARPPGPPNPATYVYGESKAEVVAKARDAVRA